MKKSNKSHFQY